MSKNTGTTIDRPLIDKELDTVGPNVGEHAVKAYNNEVSTYMDVVGVFIYSCGYDQTTAEGFATKIHNEKAATCFWGSKKRCEDVIADFKAIGVEAILTGGSDGPGN